MSDSPASVALVPGEIVAGKYRVDRTLGAGGMGVVVAATHIDLDRPVAIKLIREELVSDPSVVERLMLEAKAAARIRSEHVGRVLDVGKLPSGAPYIVMEYLDGFDLCEMLEQGGPLKVTQAVDFLMQACEAIAEAHAANIVHRDLKPENLFVAHLPDGSPIIKVLDFGISKELGNAERRALTNPSTAVGSPRYMAPEQMQGTGVDTRADVWALGAILYECLSNHPAFDSDTLPGVCAQVLSEDPKPVQMLAPHVPDRLSEIIARCLRKAPAERFANVAELAEALAPFGTERAIISCRRIVALLGSSSTMVSGSGASASRETAASAAHGIDAQGQTAVVDTGPVASRAVSGTTAGRGMAVDVATGPTPKRDTKAQRPKTPVWPFAALGLLMVGGAGTAVFLFAFTDPAESALAGNPSPSSIAEPASSNLRSEPSTSLVAPEPRSSRSPSVQLLPSADAGPSDADPIEPEQEKNEPEKVTTPRAPAVRPRPVPRPAPPSPGTPEKEKSDPWDPNNFGDRH